MSPLERIQSFFQYLLAATSRHPVWVVTITLMLVAIGIFQASKLRIELDLYGKDVRGFQSTIDFQDQRRRYGDLNVAILIFSPKHNSFRIRDVCQIRDWMAKEQIRNPEIKSITTPFDIRQAKRIDDRIGYYRLFEFPCDSSTEKELDTAADFRSLSTTPWKNVLTDRSARDFAVEVTFRDTVGDSRFGRFDPEPVKHLYEKAEREIKPLIPGVDLLVVGASAFDSHLKDAMKRDFWLQGVVFVIIFVAFRLYLGTFLSGFIFLGSLVINLSFVFGCMSFFNAPVNLLTNNLVLMTTLAGLEDFLFIAMLMRTGVSLEESLRQMIAPSFFTTLTTVIGFASLKTSEVDMIADFGIWEALGSFFEWAVMFLVMPSICKLIPRLGMWADRSRALSMAWLSRLVHLKPPKRAIPISLVFLFLGVGGFSYLNLNEIPTRNFPYDHLTSRSHRYLLESRGWESAVYLVFSGAEIRNERDRVDSVIATLKKEPNVVNITNPFDLERFVAEKLSDEDKQVVRTEIQITSGFKKLFSGKDEARAMVYLDKSDLYSLDQFTARVREVCPENFCRVSGHSAVYLEYSKKIVPTLLDSFGTSLTLVSLMILCLAWLAGVQERIALIYSAVWGPVVMLGLIAALQIPVSLITSLFASTMVGLTGDNAIQYLFAAKGRNLQQGLDERAEGSIVLSLLLSVCSLVFLAETVKPMQILGILFFIGFLVTLVGDLYLLKGAIKSPEDA